MIPSIWDPGGHPEAIAKFEVLRDVTRQELGGTDNLISTEMDQTIVDLKAQMASAENMNSNAVDEPGACTKRRGGDGSDGA